MRRFRAVIGHFRLSTLLQIAPPASIATVLREPRARLPCTPSRVHIAIWQPRGGHIQTSAARACRRSARSTSFFRSR
jgi:hypothetical protein